MGSRRERLAELRKQAGHTQQTLAAALNVSRRTVLRWEDGSADPHPAQRRDLATTLDIPMDELADVLRGGPGTSHGDHGARSQVRAPTDGPPGSVPDDTDGSSPKRWTRRHTALVSLAVAGLLVLAGIFVSRIAGDIPAVAAADAAASTPLVSLHSGKCVSVTGDVLAQGTAAHQHPCTGTAGRTWRLERVEQGRTEPTPFLIVGVDSRLCLMPSEQRFGGARRIAQQTCDPTSDVQQWRFVPAQPQRNGHTYGQFINMQRGSCLDVNGGGVADGTPVVLWTCGTQLNQLFGFTAAAHSS